ncbi:MAG: hypothetical protein JRH20_19070 [Deltaproteobacteria bacterium]|nr:hypothetical protein [Deltaproteobacteria bacterium]
MQIGVITNPHSRKNQGRPQRLEQLQAVVGDMGEVHQTSDTEAIKPVLREFLRKRARYWVADGGDGSLHWMLRRGLEVLDEDEFRGMTLPLAVPTNGGSIDFVAKNVGLSGSAEVILERLRDALEAGQQIEEVEVDSLRVEGIEVTDAGERPVKTLGFAVAGGGVGQRFFEKLFEAESHTSSTMLSVIVKLFASYPVAYSPLRGLPGMPRLLKEYARDIFRPTPARVWIDGKLMAPEAFTGIHVAAMSINLGNILRYFHHADTLGQLHAIVGAPSGREILANVPRMITGGAFKASNSYDGPCKELVVEAQGDELLAPVIDGEAYPNLRRVSFSIGPRVRIPKVTGRSSTSRW